MPTNRDSLFPSASIGRAGSSQLHRASSHESLNAHPLLTPSSPSSTSSSQTPGPEAASTAPRYVPYTPRHRPPASSATTGMTAQSTVPVASHQHQQGGATIKLQLQNLKAAAQTIGLGTGTIGWAILEKLVDGEAGSEWDEIWIAVTTAKPTLLLPLEPYSGEVITSELVKDHIAFCTGPSPSPLVTLSGLRGTISNGSLIIQTTLPTNSAAFQDLLKPDLQSGALLSLPPLFSPLDSNTISPFPSVALTGSTTLPLPPRFHPSKPPLPPRPGLVSPASSVPKPTTTPRITNPFASLFGRPSPPPAGSTSPSPSLASLPSDDVHPAPSVGVEVAAFSVNKKVVKKILGKEISRIINNEIRERLSGCPAWVVERVIDFTGPLHPIPKSSKRPDVRRTSNFRGRSPMLSPPSTQQSADPGALADAFQDFYECIEEDIKAGRSGSPLLGRGKELKRAISFSQIDVNTSDETSEEVKELPEPGREEKAAGEAKIREILEQIESAMCCVFYDRTFRPLLGDDTSHDDALANRIAALNMLDLGLEHLGVEIPSTAKVDVEKVVKGCGTILQRLEGHEYRSPAKKSALLVEAHKQVVEGLSRLPQLQLKPEREFEEQDQKTPNASTFGKQATQEALHEASIPSPTGPEPANVLETGQTVVLKEETFSSEKQTISSQTVESSHSTLPQSSGSDTVDTIAKEPHLTEDLREGSQSPPLPPDSSQSSSPSSVSCREASTSPASVTVSGDLLFPFLIFSVVKSNPAHLVSHLLYTQRFRSRSIGGRESYCLINLMAVVEFLEHVDMGALGLGDSDRVMSTADLSPIPLARGPIDSNLSSPSLFSSRIGKRVNQQVEELAGLAGSANKVITGVVDSSFGVLRGFLTSNPDLSTPHGQVQDSAPWNAIRPGFGLLRRGSGFTIANVTSALPGTSRPKTPAGDAEEGQQLIEVPSRPGSIKSSTLEEHDEEGTSTSSVASDDDDSPEGETRDRGDTRSVKSFSSMMSESRERERDRERAELKERMSITDRLANMSVRSKLATAPPVEHHTAKPSPPSSKPTSRPSSWLPPPIASTTQPDAPSTAPPSLPKIRIPPPSRRFLECAEQDIRVGEVGELLREYRRMVQALRATGAFEDQL